jgi:hypothetical protein
MKNDLNLYTTIEQIQNILSTFDLSGINLTDKLEILEQNITIHNDSGSAVMKWIDLICGLDCSRPEIANRRKYDRNAQGKWI